MYEYNATKKKTLKPVAIIFLFDNGEMKWKSCFLHKLEQRTN